MNVVIIDYFYFIFNKYKMSIKVNFNNQILECPKNNYSPNPNKTIIKVSNGTNTYSCNPNSNTMKLGECSIVYGTQACNTILKDYKKSQIYYEEMEHICCAITGKKSSII